MKRRPLTQRQRLVRAIRAYAAAEVEDSWKGGGDPDAIPEIEEWLDKKREALNRELDRTFGEQP